MEDEMNATKRGFNMGFLVMSVLVLAAACTSRSTDPVTVHSSGIATWRPEQPSRIAVVTLGPTDMMYQDWFEFEPNVRDWLARDPTFSTIKRKRLVRKTYSLEESFQLQFQRTASNIGGCGQAALYCLVLSVVTHPIAAVLRSTVGEWKTVQPAPRVQSLNDVKSVGSKLPIGLLDKEKLADAIGERVARLGGERTVHEFILMPFEEIADASLPASRTDATLTIRVQSVGLITTDHDDPRISLELHLWTNLNGTDGRPWKYIGEPRKLDEWTANNARLFRHDLDYAVETIANQIIGESYPRNES